MTNNEITLAREILIAVASSGEMSKLMAQVASQRGVNADDLVAQLAIKSAQAFYRAVGEA